MLRGVDDVSSARIPARVVAAKGSAAVEQRVRPAADAICEPRTLERETVLDGVQNVLDQAGAELGVRHGERRLVAKQRMRTVEELSSRLGVTPHSLGQRNHTRETFGSRALIRVETRASLERRGWNDRVDECRGRRARRLRRAGRRAAATASAGPRGRACRGPARSALVCGGPRNPPSTSATRSAAPMACLWYQMSLYLQPYDTTVEPARANRELGATSGLSEGAALRSTR